MYSLYFVNRSAYQIEKHPRVADRPLNLLDHSNKSLVVEKLLQTEDDNTCVVQIQEV